MAKRIGADRKRKRNTARKSRPKALHRSKSVERSKSKETRKSRGPSESDKGDRARLVAKRRDRGHLDRNPSDTISDPIGSRGIVKQQAATARGLTGTGEGDNTPRFKTIFNRVKDSSPANDLPPSEATSPKADTYKVGTEVEPAPELEGREPISTSRDALGEKKTYKVGDREVTRTARVDGSVVTTYEDEHGNPHTKTTNKDGSSRLVIGGEASVGEDLNSRTLNYDRDGNVVSEQVHRRSFHPEGGQKRERVHNVDYGPDGQPTKTFERDNTYDSSGKELSTSRKEVEFRSDGTQLVSERVKNKDGSGFLETRQVGPGGETTSSDRFDIGKGGLDPVAFTEKLSELARAGSPEKMEEILQFVGKEELARVSLSAAQGDPEALQDFVGAASMAADLSPEVSKLLAEGWHDGIATDKYSSDPKRDDGQITDDTQALASALQSQIGEGGSSNLGVSFFDKLNDTHQRELEKVSSKAPGSDGRDMFELDARLGSVAVSLADGFQTQFDRFEEATSAADEQSARLAQLNEAFAGFMSEEERGKAVKEFYDHHSEEYNQADVASGKLVANLDGLNRFHDILGDPIDRSQARLEADGSFPPLGLSEGSSTVRDLLGQAPEKLVRASETRSGSKELADALIREGAKPNSTFIPKLKQAAHDPEQKENLEAAIENVGISAAAEARASGDTERLEQLLDGVSTSSENFTPEAIATLKKFASGTGDINRVKNSPDFGPRLGRAASVLGLANLAANGVSVASGDADAEALIGLGADSVDVGKDIFRESLEQALGTEALKTAGKVTSGVGLVLGVVDTLQALEQGDHAGAALSAVSTLGGALVASNVVPVLGHALVAAAIVGSVGLAQYRKAEASNYFEEGHPGAEDATRFIGHALKNLDLSPSKKEALTNKLKDSDDDGTLPGARIQEVADKAGVGRSAFLERMATLEPEEAGEVISAVHSVGGTNVALLTKIGVEEVYRDVTIADLTQYIEQEYPRIL